MDPERIPKKTINNILTVIAALFLMFWAWKWFGPGSAEIRQSGEAELRRSGLSLVYKFTVRRSGIIPGHH